MSEYTLSEIFGIIATGGFLLIATTAVVYAYWTLIKEAITDIKEEPFLSIVIVIILFIVLFGMLSLLFGALGI